MTLTEGDKAECKEIAREIIKEVLLVHVECCPHGKTLLTSKWLLVGVLIGSGFSGGTLALAIMKLITG